MYFKKFWEARQFYSQPTWLFLIGTASLIVYSAFRVLLEDAGKLGEILTALLGLVAILVCGKRIKRSAALWLLLAAVLVQVLSWTLGYFHHPEWVESNPKIDRLAKLFIFIGVAWWLGGSTRNTLLIWLLAVVCYCLATFFHGDGLNEWIVGLQGERVGFGIRNKQHGAMLFGVVFLGMTVFSRRLFAQGNYRALRISLWLCLFLISFIGVLIGQTRAIWLALAAALPISAMIYLVNVRFNKASSHHLKVFIVSLALVGFSVLGLGVAFKDTLQERVGAESQVVDQLLHGNLEELPYSSIGIRIHSWRAASEWIAERPLVGWGGDGRSLVIDETEWLPDFVKQNFGHLHNFFLEVWVAYGVLGLAVIGALAIWVGRATWLAWRGGVLPGDIALFGAGFFVYWMIVNQFESYNSFWTGVYVHNLVLGGLVTHYWRWQLMVKERSSESAQVQ